MFGMFDISTLFVIGLQSALN